MQQAGDRLGLRALVIVTLVVLAVSPALAQLSDRTGLVSRFDVESGGRQYEVVITANFDATGARFDPTVRELQIDVNSSLDSNLGELVLPRQLLDGIEVRIDGQLVPARVESSERTWFVTVEFDGDGRHLMQISEPTGGGCLVATAAYGTEAASAVQRLREARERVVTTEAGSMFMDTFNAVYYAVSPTAADLSRQSPPLRSISLVLLSPALASASLVELAESDLQVVMLGSVALLACMGAYIGVPAAALLCVARLRRTIHQ